MSSDANDTRVAMTTGQDERSIFPNLLFPSASDALSGCSISPVSHSYKAKHLQDVVHPQEICSPGSSITRNFDLAPVLPFTPTLLSAGGTA